MKKIKAVIFDVDETLVDRKEAFIRLCEYLIDKYSPKYPFQCSKEELISHMIKIDANGYGVLEDFIPKLDKWWKLPLSSQDFINERNQIFGSLTIPYPEIYEVLDILKEKYKLGIITNGFSTVQREKIKTVKITDYFDDIVVSGETEFAKPDPQIFFMSCKNLGVKPEEAVYVGDYYPNDIIGAIRSGITPIWITDSLKEHEEYKGIRVSRLKDILKLL